MHKHNMKQTWRTITDTITDTITLSKQVNNREILTVIIINEETLTITKI